MDAAAGPLEPVVPGGGTGAIQPVAPGGATGAIEPAAHPAPAAVVAAEVEAAGPVRYVGLATRVISFTIDAAVIDLVALMVGIGASLILSLLHISGPLKAILAVIGGAAFILWSIGYFVVFWSTTGQTPGARIMQLRVLTTDGAVIKPRRALLRCVGVVLAALPLFAGFVRILFDPRRRGFQDRLAGTVVVEAPQTSYIATARAAARRARARQPDPDPERPVPPG